MSRRTAWYAWQREVASAFPHLSKPMATVLALWSFGIVLARSCGLATVATFLASLRAQQPNTVRQRLREFYQEARAKAGTRRRQLDVPTGFGPLLRWILRDWVGRHLPLALDATTLGQRFVVLAVGVVYRGTAIPIAWKVLQATAAQPWKQPWLDLLHQLQGVVPSTYHVIALADRGWWAKGLFEGIGAVGWHPLLRIKAGGTFRPAGWHTFRSLKGFTPQVGLRWSGRGTAFATQAAHRECTLRASWGAGHAEPWLIRTALPPARGDARWYALRAWIEQGFKDSKRGGWQWHATRMTAAARAERLWLAVAVATVWVVRVGGVDEDQPASAADALPELRLCTAAPSRAPRSSARRLRPQRLWRPVSVFRRGWIVIVTALVRGQRLPLGQWLPEDWPELPQEPTPAPANAIGEVAA